MNVDSHTEDFVTSDRQQTESNGSVELALAMATSSNWADRAAAVRILAGHIDDPRTRVQLSRSMGDLDTAVVAETIKAAVTAGGIAGTRDALQHLATSGDDIGYYIRDQLVELRMDGFPVLDVVREILREEPAGAHRDGALELIDLLKAT